MSENQKLYLYLHTHWDREWYFPFEIYRTQLISLTREVVKKLETGELPNFLFDGQASPLEDVLEIDPGLTNRIKNLIETGKLGAGPWYVLADQMLVSGESLIRNLKMGLEATSRFGPPNMIGYCPDTFGHSHDLPRILSGFNIKTAYVWRGVPELKDGPLFWWQSPDGSKVLTYHLSRGYYQTLFHDNLSDEQRAAQLTLWTGSQPQEPTQPKVFCKSVNGSLLPVGGDHMAPPANFHEHLEALKARLNEQGYTEPLARDNEKKKINFAPVPLSEFSRSLVNATSSDTNNIQLINSELRDNSNSLRYGRAYLLPGVLSARLYLKRENRLAEHRLIRISEPIASLLHLSRQLPYPHLELNYAWKLLLKNHPHDSICGCSVDAVHQEMVTRSKKQNQVLDALDRMAREQVAQETSSDYHSKATEKPMLSVSKMVSFDPAFDANSLAVYNLTIETVKAPIRFTWAGDVSLKQKADFDALVPASLLASDGSDVQVNALQLKKDAELFSHAGGVPTFKHVQYFDGWVWADRIPGLGLKEVSWRGPHFRETQDKEVKPGDTSDLVKVGPRRLANEFFEVDIQNDGSLKVMAVEGTNRKDFVLGHSIRDVADSGDTYNFDPLESDRPLYAKLTACSIAQKGPLVGSLLLTYELDIPVGLEDTDPPLSTDPTAPPRVRSFKRTDEKITHRFSTEISIRRGVPIVFFETTWDNHARDHRLEVVFHTGSTVEKTFSENHFSVTERDAINPKSTLPVAPGNEASPDRYPCQRFFLANGQAFLNSGLPEYGAEDSAVVFTILRATSRLSRPRLRTRGSGAGPSLDTPEANCFGQNKASYGWSPLPGKVSGKVTHNNLSDGSLIHAYRMAELFEGTFWTSLAHRSKEKFDGSFLGIDNPAIRLVALYNNEDRTSACLRLLNVTRQPQEATLTLNVPIRHAHSCLLNGEVLEELGSVEVDAPYSVKHKRYKLKFRTNELVTLKLAT